MSDKITKTFKVIRNFCQENSDDLMVKKYSRYFSEGYDAYGLQQSKWEELKQKTLLDYAKDFSLNEFFELSEILVKQGRYEEISLGIMIIVHNKEELKAQHMKYVEKWFDNGINNWAHTDILSRDLLSYLLVKNIISKEYLAQWAHSEFKWKRRALPVTFLYALNTDSNILEILNLIRPLMHEPEKHVQQGIGWFLRECWKKFPKETEKFLTEYKDSSPRVIYQYATEKMTPEQKANFKKEKKHA